MAYKNSARFGAGTSAQPFCACLAATTASSTSLEVDSGMVASCSPFAGFVTAILCKCECVFHLPPI